MEVCSLQYVTDPERSPTESTLLTCNTVKPLYLAYSKSQVGICHKDLRLQTYSGTATNSHFTLCEIKLRCEVKRGCEIKEP